MKPKPHEESRRTPQQRLVNELAHRTAAAARTDEREYEDLFTHLSLSHMWPEGVRQARNHVDQNRALAEEAVQEAQLKADAQLSSGEAPPDFCAWFAVVVRNASFDILRAEYKTRMKFRPHLVPLDEKLDRYRDRDVCDSDTDKLDIARALNFLTPKEQEVVRMRLNDIAVKAIAEKLGISRQAVNKRWNSAITKLAVLLRTFRDEETSD